MDEKKIEVTVDQVAEAVARTIDGEHISRLVEKSPFLILVLAEFGAELMHTLFDDEKEGDKHE